MDSDLRNRFRGISRPATPVLRPLRPAAPVRPMSAAPVSHPPAKPASQVVASKPVPKALHEPAQPKVTGRLGYAAATPGKASGNSNKKKRKKLTKKKRVLFTSAIVLVLILMGGGVFALKNRNGTGSGFRLGSGEKTPAPGNGVPNGTIDTERDKPVVTGTIRLVATGDMIAHDSVNANARKTDGTYDYTALMAGMKPYFEKADIRFCNQSTPAGGDAFGISGYPVFNAPIEFARGIEGVGCNLINIGTNHTNDKGQGLIDATVAAWDNREGILAVAGANRSLGEQNQSRTFTVKGIKFAFLSYSTYSNNTSLTPHGVNMYSDALATAQVAEAKKNADFVIVSMRWGTEYSPDVNAQQDAIAQTLTNLGADVILGHGPHVLEPVKKIKSADGSKESVVWYSIGNFLNTQLETEALIGGFATMDIDAATKKVTSVGFLPTYMHYDWTAAEKRANNLLARKNLQMVPLDQAAELLGKSLLNTTVEAQIARVTGVLNKFTEVKILKSSEF